MVCPWNLCKILFYMKHLSGYDNIFETEAWYFLGNMKVLLEHLDRRMDTKGPQSDPADKAFLCLCIVSNVSNVWVFYEDLDKDF